MKRATIKGDIVYQYIIMNFYIPCIDFVRCMFVCYIYTYMF